MSLVREVWTRRAYRNRQFANQDRLPVRCLKPITYGAQVNTHGLIAIGLANKDRNGIERRRDGDQNRRLIGCWCRPANRLISFQRPVQQNKYVSINGGCTQSKRSSQSITGKELAVSVNTPANENVATGNTPNPCRCTVPSSRPIA